MNNGLHDRGMLDVIRELSAQRASGRLHISTGMTEGALFFARGQLVDARLGRLSGFQAINALVSVPDASYDFDPSIAPPAQSSIAPNERLLLKDFFGIDVVDGEVRPKPDHRDEAFVAEPARGRIFAEPRVPLSNRPLTRSRFLPALFVLLVTVLVAAAAVVLLNRLRKPDSTALAVQTAPPDGTQPTQQPETQTTPAVPDLTGNWTVINTVEQTAYEPYRNMEIGFNVAINQAGRDFTGTGEKISENGRSLPAAGRTPIQVKGTIDGDKIQATFSENGAARKTNGRFVWLIDRGNGGLTGTFISTAARTSGKSAAKKSL